MKHASVFTISNSTHSWIGSLAPSLKQAENAAVTRKPEEAIDRVPPGFLYAKENMEISQVAVPDQVVDGVGVAVDPVAGVVAEVLIAELTH